MKKILLLTAVSAISQVFSCCCFDTSRVVTACGKAIQQGTLFPAVSEEPMRLQIMQAFTGDMLTDLEITELPRKTELTLRTFLLDHNMFVKDQELKFFLASLCGINSEFCSFLLKEKLVEGGELRELVFQKFDLRYPVQNPPYTPSWADKSYERIAQNLLSCTNFSCLTFTPWVSTAILYHMPGVYATSSLLFYCFLSSALISYTVPIITVPYFFDCKGHCNGYFDNSFWCANPRFSCDTCDLLGDCLYCLCGPRCLMKWC